MRTADAKARIITDAQVEESRFWSKVDIAGDGLCWNWRGAVNATGGYGMFHRSLRLHGPSAFVYSHRLSFEYAHGGIPDGHVIDHLCANRLCVNPNHLQATTSRMNIARMPRFNAGAL